MKKLLSNIIFLFVFFRVAVGQKLPFQNFSVDKGLIQSQVLCITQDKQHHLWLGTFGGLDRFDGTSFRHFSKSDGLNSSAITCMYTARSGKIWAGTFKGISCYDGYNIINYPVQGKSGSFNFTSIAEDETGATWALSFTNGLFVFQGNQFVKAPLPFNESIPTCLFNDSNGLLLAGFYKKGIYYYSKKWWQRFSNMPHADTAALLGVINNTRENYFAFTNKLQLLKFSNRALIATTQVKASIVNTICMDNKGDIWVGINKGVVVYSGKDLSVIATYTAASGLSDNAVNYIYKDAEGNMWIGTDGDGLFRFSGGAFAKFDNSNGLPGNIVMGIVKDKSENIFIGTREGGLLQYNPGSKTMSTIEYSMFSKAGINCMAADKHGNIFFGTMDSRLLKYNGKTLKEIRLEKGANPFINTILAEEAKIWFTTSAGCYYLKGDSAFKVKGLDEIAIGVLRIADGEVLIGSTNGIYSVSAKSIAKKISTPAFDGIEVRCFSRYKKYILIGTADEGIFFWDKQSGTFYQCDSRNGLFDNQVFSIFVDSKENVWAGTGTGIQQIIFNEKDFSFQVKKFSKADGYENAENNLNAVAEDKDGAVWFGTTKGAFIYNQAQAFKNHSKPFTLFQQVAVSASVTDSATSKNIYPWYHLPVSPVLPYENNSISFTVKGIFLNDPDAVTYSYQLVGYDTGFSKPVAQTFFNYQSLEPGKYIFRVKSYTAEGTVSENIAEYPFVVSTPFRKSKWFLFLITGLLILTGVLLQLFITKRKQQRQQQLELLRQDEQQKIRQRTAEDFHDELGNKLTRISLLADILQKKIGQDDADKNNLLQQIRENVLNLYAGTKDIIWSLSPASDNLLEVLKRIRHFGEELFHDSEIDFSFTGLDEIDAAVKLPGDYSRNIIMIFKELLNNSLRHSKALKITIAVSNAGNDEIIIAQSDNGIGFSEISGKKGNGLNNIQRRAERIGAAVTFVSNEKEGTVASLKLKIPSNGGWNPENNKSLLR